MVEASSVCTEDNQDDVSKVRLCVVIFETISVCTKCHIAIDTFEHNLSPHAPHWTHAASGFCVSWYVICLLVAVWIHYDVSYLILRQHTSSFHTRNLPFHLENVQHNTTAATQSQLTEILNLCEIRDGNVSFPSLRTVIQLPVVMP